MIGASIIPLLMMTKKGEKTMTKEKTKNEIVLDLLVPGKKVAPENINAALGGPYAARYISALRKLGYDIQSVKEGRSVVAYMMVAAVAEEVVEEEEVIEDDEGEILETATTDDESEDEEEEVAPLAASSSETSFSVSEDWDEYEGDVRDLVV